MSEPVNPLDALIAAHERLGLPPIAQMPGKRWEGRFGTWAFVMNAGKRAIKKRGVTIKPFNLYVEYNGWPAGVLGPTGEGQFAAGTGANPERFAAALAEWDGR